MDQAIVSQRSLVTSSVAGGCAEITPRVTNASHVVGDSM
jgi:hypothetical protein